MASKITNKIPLLGFAFFRKEDERDKALYEQEHFRPMNIPFDPEVHKNLLPVELRGAGTYDCAVVDHFLQVKTPWFKYRIRIGNAAERTYFKWSKFATVLKTPVASDAVFYTFYHGLHRYDNG